MRPSSGNGPLPDAMEAGAAVVAFDTGAVSTARRALPAEEPLEIAYGGVPFAVMMVTPSDLEDFAFGFSLTEGIVESRQDIRQVRVEPAENGLRCAIELSPERLHGHLARRRALSGRTGCGLCGIDDLASLPHARAPEGEAPPVAVEAIRRALAGMEDAQPLNDLTRGVHAAAWAGLDGDIVLVREDVGRHNALDKLIGALLRRHADPGRGFAVVTSRCSFELVEKIAAFRARTLVSVSAPTSRALDRARALDITLVGIARRDSMTVFHGLERILKQEPIA
jgi:FdhD protein